MHVYAYTLMFGGVAFAQAANKLIKQASIEHSSSIVDCN